MDRGMQMGEGGRVEPVASLPGPSGLKELREKIVLVDALIHADDCESKDVHSTRCKASGEVLGLFDAIFPAALAAPEAASAEGSPSHPSGPSQDSQEVSEAIETLRGFAKRWCDDGQCRNINGYSHDPECRDFYNAIDAVEAVLSQSPKGAAVDPNRPKGARVPQNWVEAYAREDAWGPVIQALARDLMDMTANFGAAMNRLEAGGESGPSAPKTGLRGASRRYAEEGITESTKPEVKQEVCELYGMWLDGRITAAVLANKSYLAGYLKRHMEGIGGAA